MSTALQPSLEFLVPLRIVELQQQGGITDDDLERIRPYADELAGRADAMMYDSRSPEAKGLLTKLVDAIAVMSFLPGGITVFGHWETT